jgi:IS5 family transposase
VPLKRMLRIYLLQLWFNLSDPAVEEALYDSAAMRSFARIDLGREPVPDETTVCKFRRLLEKHKLGEVSFKAVNRHLHEQGIKVSRGTIVDASIISAPSSTKNKCGERDPHLHRMQVTCALANLFMVRRRLLTDGSNIGDRRVDEITSTTDRTPTRSLDLVKVEPPVGRERDVGTSHRQFFRLSLD